MSIPCLKTPSISTFFTSIPLFPCTNCTQYVFSFAHQFQTRKKNTLCSKQNTKSYLFNFGYNAATSLTFGGKYTQRSPGSILISITKARHWSWKLFCGDVLHTKKFNESEKGTIIKLSIEVNNRSLILFNVLNCSRHSGLR